MGDGITALPGEITKPCQRIGELRQRNAFGKFLRLVLAPNEKQAQPRHQGDRRIYGEDKKQDNLPDVFRAILMRQLSNYFKIWQYVTAFRCKHDAFFNRPNKNVHIQR
jgi:hypothetical protein